MSMEQKEYFRQGHEIGFLEGVGQVIEILASEKIVSPNVLTKIRALRDINNSRDRVLNPESQLGAFIDTDLGQYHVSIDINLTPPRHEDEDEVSFRGRQIIDLIRDAFDQETNRINWLATLVRRTNPELMAKYNVAVQGLKDIRDDNLAPRTGARQTLKTIGETE